MKACCIHVVFLMQISGPEPEIGDKNRAMLLRMIAFMLKSEVILHDGSDIAIGESISLNT